MGEWTVIIVGVGATLLVAALLSAIGLFPVWRGKYSLRMLETELQAELMAQIKQLTADMDAERLERKKLYDQLDNEIYNRLQTDRQLEQLRGKLDAHEKNNRNQQARIQKQDEKIERLQALLMKWVSGWEQIFADYKKRQVDPPWKPDTDQLKLDGG